MSDPEIVVIGAGAAGLSAASLLRRTRREVLVLEAGPRIGGRARTCHPASLGGAMIDAGATWLHEARRNPLAALARAAGDRLDAAHQGGRRLLVGGRQADDLEERAYDAAETAWRAAAADLAPLPDRPLSAAGDRWDPGNPWLGNLDAWEGAIIAAADADSLSLQDWHRNGLGEDDLWPAGGVGALLERRLGPLAGPVRCAVAATAIDWSRPGDITVDTQAGRVRAKACIVTVSTGVLRAGGIVFTPALPDDILQALDGLPMGLLSKLALPAAGDSARDRLGLAPGTLIEQRLARRGDAMMLLTAWPDEAPYVSGFLGGRHAWSYAGREDAALEEARSRLRAAFGSTAAAAVGAGGFVSRWGSDPLFLGAYAYARPGHAGARGRLGRPFADGRLVLAGEACRTDGLAGTVGGAMLDGERAAQAVLRALGDPGPWPALVGAGI